MKQREALQEDQIMSQVESGMNDVLWLIDLVIPSD